MTAQLVIAFPVLLLMILTIVQYAVWSQASHIAQAAASQALDAARVHGGSTETATAQANATLDQLDNGTLRGRTVDVQQDADTVTVAIGGTAETIVPFLHLPIRAHAHGPTETFTTP